MERFLWICLAGAAGTGVRYLTQVWATKTFGESFPSGTLIVNLIGSFLLALLMQVALTSDRISPVLRLALATGFLGGFTTYSAFNYETLALLEHRAWGAAGLYLALTLLGCLLAGVLGLAAGRALLGA